MADQVDLVFKVPTKQLVNYRINASRKYQVPEGAPEEAFRLYNGNEKFLVRTALVRSADFKAGKSPEILNQSTLAKLCRHLTIMDQEYIVTVAVNRQMRLLAIHEVAIGARAQTGVAVEDLAKLSLLTGARGIFLVHNHPSGDPTPSPADVALTEAASSRLKCLDQHLLDHVIVAEQGHYSIMTKSFSPWY